MNLSKTILAVAAIFMIALPASSHAQSRKNASRVDFDDQLVQGQVNRGAVHLIERKDSDLGSLVKVRKSYRKEILAGTAVEQVEKPVAVPKGLPVVKPAETVEVPKTEAKSQPTPAPAKAATKAPAKSLKGSVKPAKKSAVKSSKPTAKSNGGSRVVSRR